MELIVLAPGEGHISTCLYLNIEGTGILLDCGLDPMHHGEEAVPDFDLLHGWPVDWILLSHAHMDQLGALPLAARRWPGAGILCSKATWDLARLQLMRHASLICDAFYAGNSAHYPPYEVSEVQDLDERVNFISRGERVLLEGGYNPQKVPVTAWDAGHIMGSLGYRFESDDLSLFYTGHTCARPQSVIQGAVYPSQADIVISESTIAWSDKHIAVTRREEIERMAEAVTEIGNLGGSILMPAFNMGRAQEILYILHHLKRKGRIPPLPVFLGRSAWEIARMYDHHAQEDRRLLPDFLFEETLVDVFDDEMASSLEERGQAIYLVPSGMMREGSHSWMLARSFVSQSLAGIFFVGHASEDSPAKGLYRASRGGRVQFDGEELPVHCRVERFLFNSHSNRHELVDMMGRIQPKEIVLLAGRKNSADTLSNTISDVLPEARIHLPEVGKVQELTGSNQQE